MPLLHIKWIARAWPVVCVAGRHVAQIRREVDRNTAGITPDLL